MVKITREIADAIEKVRESAVCNMLDRPCVTLELFKIWAHAAVVWVHENKTTYGYMIFEGIEIVDDPNEVDTDAKRAN